LFFRLSRGVAGILVEKWSPLTECNGPAIRIDQTEPRFGWFYPVLTELGASPGDGCRIAPALASAFVRRHTGEMAPNHFRSSLQQADDLALVERVLYRDDDVIVLDKPAGIAVHKGPKGGPVLDEAFEALRFERQEDPGLAHRLDKDTAGCLVLGRHRRALAELGRQFAAGRVGKTYWAVVRGGPAEDAGTIDAPLAKRDEHRGWFMKVAEGGQPSLTRWRVLGRGPGVAWLELVPLTGRTHQLRAHTAHAGFPILGDPIYGRAPANGARLQLLARSVNLPPLGQRAALAVTAPVPPHMGAALALCGYDGGGAVGRRAADGGASTEAS
jgi:tRNA pseudouridine32 synthase/23S rRNA pseudouridine746 synthase